MLILRPTASDSQEVNAKKANEEKINTERGFLISRIFYRLYIEMNKGLTGLSFEQYQKEKQEISSRIDSIKEEMNKIKK